eukprot:CAMPEP_0113455494 /NCGR_PEP_ID=MMETSP0014_2-20120614/8405_1 /TAXON_ID=2857 /ORGANISM="Nitzschia sp." /LENGTH=450 /DNA_ID=CAMNT_0000346927 /DNA_START=175 /DNA_END=1527 /DNA_ORIENTATION=- /assembly_acc=CAM_ASM_000159
MSVHKLIGCFAFFFVTTTTIGCQAFIPPSSSSSSTRTSSTVTSRSAFATDRRQQDDVVEIRADIDRMKEEAIRRLEALNRKLEEEDAIRNSVAVSASAAAAKVSTAGESQKTNSIVEQTLMDMANDFDREMSRPTSHAEPKEDGGDKKGIDVSPTATTISSTTTSPDQSSEVTAKTSSSSSRHPLRLLENTRWRVMLNIGRESGTWMPKTWGVSGDRLYLSCEVEFSNEVLYEQENFFNGVDGTKILKVVHNKANLAPCMSEGGRKVRIKNGGWRVVPNEGPLKTTVLRFYFDLEEETRHKGSDVYLPSGRIYCTCGYFPMADRSPCLTEKKEAHEKELRDLENQYNHMRMDMEQDESMISLGQIKRALEMMEVRHEADKLSKVVREERIKEPEKSLLRLSQDQSVGLTREGGVCCKQDKGVSVEYHILGKFELASMDNREHKDYRELLP